MQIPEITSGTVAILHIVAAACTITLLYTQDTNTSLALTVRAQYSSWKDLLDLYSNGTYPNLTAPALGAALNSSWCAFPLTPNASYSPVCACVAEQHAVFVNTSTQTLVSSCLRYRPTWRVWSVWSVYPATSATYIFLLTACFACAATQNRLLEYVSYALTIAGVIGMFVSNVSVHYPWLVAVTTAVLVIFLVLRPGLRTTFSDHPYRSCFWWTEFFVVPVYTSYIPLFNNGRDLIFVLASVGMGWIMGSFALRSIWYEVVFKEHPRLVRFLRWAAWAGILAITITMSLLAYYYRRPDSPLYMATGSIALFAGTACIALLQFPGYEGWGGFPLQVLLAIARNFSLLGLVWHDLKL